MRRRFVVQRHDVKPGEVHFDFMVERGDMLVTWKLAAPPADGVRGERSFDHRALYLDYEGEISGGRGSVSIVERGELADVEGDPDAPVYVFRIAERTLEIRVDEGARVTCRARPRA